MVTFDGMYCQYTKYSCWLLIIKKLCKDYRSSPFDLQSVWFDQIEMSQSRSQNKVPGVVPYDDPLMQNSDDRGRPFQPHGASRLIP